MNKNIYTNIAVFFKKIKKSIFEILQWHFILFISKANSDETLFIPFDSGYHYTLRFLISGKLTVADVESELSYGSNLYTSRIFILGARAAIDHFQQLEDLRHSTMLKRAADFKKMNPTTELLGVKNEIVDR